MIRRTSGTGRTDEGQVTLLVIGFTVIALLLITVVIDVSKVFLAQREIGAAVDGAAVAAAGAVDEAAVYTGGVGGAVPLDPTVARERVAAYVTAAGLAEEFDQFSVQSVDVAGAEVTVTVRAVVHLPYEALVPGAYRDGVAVTVSASARSPVVTG